MSIDLSQFFEVFFEESFEGLDAMEAELLNLVPGEEDLETINTIFRAAHSIKGGSGTFGFNSVSDFTHVLETLLDQIREGKRELTAEHVNLLLKAVDCLRALLSALQAEQDPNLEDAIALRIKFEEILGVNQSGATKVAAEEQPAQPEFNTYQIDFKPHHHLFKTGNEPLYMISELAELGDLETLAFHNELPDITDLSADDCFLSWRFFLNTVKDESAIREIFEWVEDDADISITLCGGLFAEQQQATIEEPAVENIESSPEVAEVAEVVAVNPSKKAATAKVTTPAAAESTSIRVGIDKVDSLINMVGELVITQAMLSQIGEQEITETTIASLQEGLAQLAHNTRDLQESVMRIRMLPISFVFSRFPRLVRDISQKLNKQVELKLLGEQTELDKTVMEKISDPMVHLVRNSLDKIAQQLLSQAVKY
jgi:two-component system chemotaxis sensor kinase CheA